MQSHARRVPLFRALTSVLTTVLLVAGPLWAGGSLVDGPPRGTTDGHVIKVLDGDTVDVQTGTGMVRLRYGGIAAPELHNRIPYAARLGSQAWEANRALVEGKAIRYEALKNKDKYGRVDALVYVGNTFVNEALVAQGMASYAYPVPAPQRLLLQQAERAAKARHLGMWRLPCPEE